MVSVSLSPSTSPRTISGCCGLNQKSTAPLTQRIMHPLHQVSSETGLNTTSKWYVGPLLGNGELCLFLDENGAMNDYTALTARYSPRIYWAGRRLDTQSRPMVP